MSSRISKTHLKALQGSGEDVRLTIRVDKMLHKKFLKKTIDEDSSMTEKIIEWIKEYIK